MGRDVLVGPRLKIRRAWDQLNGLRADIGSYINPYPFTLSVHFDQYTARLTVKAHAGRPVDPIWSVRVGETVHDFRSALDHIVWELAGRPAPVEALTQFPIFQTEAGFLSRGVKKFLKGVKSTKAIELIKQEQPFSPTIEGIPEGTLSPLWHLKELSDVDKHRTIHVTAAMLSAFSINTPRLTQKITVTDIHQMQPGPIREEIVVWTGILRGAVGWPFETDKVNGTVAVDVIFEEGFPSAGLWSVTGTLIECGNRVERILRRLAEDVFETEL